MTHDKIAKCVFADIKSHASLKNTNEIKMLEKYGYNWEFPFKNTKRFLTKQNIIVETIPEIIEVEEDTNLTFDRTLSDRLFSFVAESKRTKLPFQQMLNHYEDEMSYKKTMYSSEPLKLPQFDHKLQKKEEEKKANLPKLSVDQIENALQSILSQSSKKTITLEGVDFSKMASTKISVSHFKRMESVRNPADVMTDQKITSEFTFDSNFEDETLSTQIELMCTNINIEESLGVLDKTWSGQGYQPYNANSKVIFDGSYAGIDGVVTLRYIRQLQSNVMNEVNDIRESILALSHMYSLKTLLNMAAAKKTTPGNEAEDDKVEEEAINHVLKTIDIEMMNE